jgi:multidrug efflux pump subunit AcrA (membrane-fusion protein)
MRSLEEWERLPKKRLRSSPDPDAAILIAASAAKQRIYIYYDGGSTPGAGRWIRPGCVFRVHGDGTVYVEAFCEARQAQRNFRLARLRLGRASSGAVLCGPGLTSGMTAGVRGRSPIRTPERRLPGPARWIVWLVLVPVGLLVLAHACGSQ